MKFKMKILLAMCCLGVAVLVGASESFGDEADKGEKSKKVSKSDFLKGPKVDRDNKESRDFRGRKRKGMMMGGKGKRFGDGGGGEMLLRELNLSEKQQSQLKKINEAKKAEMKKFSEEHKDEIATLNARMDVARKAKDRDAMKKIQAERKALFKKGPLNGDRLKDLKSVLNDKQLGTLEKRIAERKAAAKKNRKDAKGKKVKSDDDALDKVNEKRRAKKAKRRNVKKREKKDKDLADDK